MELDINLKVKIRKIIRYNTQELNDYIYQWDKAYVSQKEYLQFCKTIKFSQKDIYDFLCKEMIKTLMSELSATVRKHPSQVFYFLKDNKFIDQAYERDPRNTFNRELFLSNNYFNNREDVEKLIRLSKHYKNKILLAAEMPRKLIPNKENTRCLPHLH